MPTVKRKRDGDAGSSRRRARRSSNSEASSSRNPPTTPTTAPATPAPAPAPAPTLAPTSALRVTHNIHHVANADEARCCLDGRCVRCIDYRLLAEKVRDEYGCVLVRPGAAPRIDNDDNDPTQPTYRQDNAAFETICELEADKEELQTEIEGLKKHEKENAEMRKQLEAVKKDTTNLKRQLTIAKKHTEAHASLRKEHDRSSTKIALLQKAVDDGPEHVFAVLYRIESGFEHNQLKGSVEIKGLFQKRDQANAAFHHLCKVTFPRWRSMEVKDVEVSDNDTADVSPGQNEVLRWQSSINEMRVVVGLPYGGRAFLWVQQRGLQGQTDLDALQVEAKQVTKSRKAEKAAKKAARKAAKNEARAMSSIETPLHSSLGLDLLQQDGMLSPLDEEPFEGVPFTPNNNSQAQPSRPHSDTAPKASIVPLPGSGPAPAAATLRFYHGRCTVVSLDRETTAESDLRLDVRKHESTPEHEVAAGLGGSYRAPFPEMRIKSESASPASAPMKRRFFVGD